MSLHSHSDFYKKLQGWGDTGHKSTVKCINTEGTDNEMHSFNVRTTVQKYQAKGAFGGSE